eukprot:CAMPEP_0171299686 /NCGR_PEP_ID=MMETSP0816-20121228/8550_1 /TAXON_ID=420281 /ORGANISM="Proboscia inermis, Strain CCAP1064/1" /LENGTH=269 /DNA_ID=CAMNT_0011775695 /DNA_START=18 /DNA_END=827 /DNA_ORIENTATION=+
MDNTDKSLAEQKKELGNKAFASKNYEEAIALYTEAIKCEPNNHVYFSNRAASYGSISKWDSSASDAKKCIELDPTFVKGYYRLATAQIELNDLDGAHSTIKQGLNVDPSNNQLSKQLRIVNGKKKEIAKAIAKKAKSAGNNAAPRSVGNVDSSVSQELMDLQEQYISTNREYNTVTAHITKAQREQRTNELTKSELEKLPQESSSKMYRSIGKMFLLSGREAIMDHLGTAMKDEAKKEVDLKQKLDYLERRIKSQRQNIQELSAVSSRA